MPQNTQDTTQALLDPLQQADQTLRELAGVILRSPEAFRSVWEIVDNVFDRYYHSKAA